MSQTQILELIVALETYTELSALLENLAHELVIKDLEEGLEGTLPAEDCGRLSKATLLLQQAAVLIGEIDKGAHQ